MRARTLGLVALLLAGCGTSGPGGPIPFHSVASGRGPENGLDGTLKLPAGGGRFPVVIVLHGCGGVGSNQRLWADRLNSWGYAAFILDSFGPRGLRTVCAPGDQYHVLPSDRASDVVSAALWLRGQAGVDPDRIAVLGASHGGATAAWVTQAVYERDYPGLLKASIDYYGVCRNPATQGTVPLLVLAGEADDWGKPALTCRTFGRALRPDQPFEIHTYPGVVHGFDNPRQDLVRLVEGHALLYDRAAAEDSYLRVRAFLARWLGSPGVGSPGVGG